MRIDLRSRENVCVKLIENLIGLMARPWLFEVKSQKQPPGLIIFDHFTSLIWLSSLDAVEDGTRIVSVNFSLQAPLYYTVRLKIPCVDRILVIAMMCNLIGEFMLWC